MFGEDWVEAVPEAIRKVEIGLEEGEVMRRDVFNDVVGAVEGGLEEMFMGTGVNKHSYLSSSQYTAMEEELRELEKKLKVGDKGRRVSIVTEGFWNDGEGEEEEDEEEDGGGKVKAVEGEGK